MAELELKLKPMHRNKYWLGKMAYRNTQITWETPVIGAYSWLPDEKWGIIVEQASSEAFEAFNSLRNFIFGLIAISLILVIVIAIIIANSIAKPIQSMASIANLMAEGKINQD
jgi:hypothetical protein